MRSHVEHAITCVMLRAAVGILLSQAKLAKDGKDFCRFQIHLLYNDDFGYIIFKKSVTKTTAHAKHSAASTR